MSNSKALRSSAAYKKRAAEWQREYRQRHPDKIAAQKKRYKESGYTRDSHLRREYGITLEQFNAQFAKQGGACAVCRTGDPGHKRGWCADHSHVTGKFRGVLCNACNIALGAMKDNPVILKNAAFYLEAHDGK